MTSTFILIAVSLLLIIIITGMEYAYLSSNKLTIELKRKQGKEAGKIVGGFFDLPERFWSGTTVSYYVLLVITCFLISKSTIWLTSLLPFKYANYLEKYPYTSMVLDLIVGSFFILTAIGFFAKRIFEFNPENKLTAWSRLVAPICDIFYPIAQVFVNLSQFILKYLFNVRIVNRKHIFERVNIRRFVEESIEGHTLQDEKNKELFEKALRLSKLKLRKCLIPRNEAIAIDINAPVQILKDKFIATKSSKIIVYDRDLDNVVGYTHHIDINRKPLSIKEILHPIPAVPETMNAIDLLYRFSKERKSIAWVIDEYGGTAGFTNLEDILEVVFGNIRDEYDIAEFTEKEINEDEYILSGRLSIDYINRKYNLAIPEDEADTLSGYIITNHSAIPDLRDKIIIDDLEFEILLVTATRIETVKVKRLMI